MLKRVSIIVSITLVISLLTSYFMDPNFNLLKFVDTLFLLSLIVFLVGSALLVIQGGFFNGINRSIKHFLRNINKTEKVISEIGGKNNKTPLPYKVNFIYMQPIVIAGFSLILISVIATLAILLFDN